eukprot:CAMPEP_0205930554 /NCGR_PEP_ID=MMETSP1325-20131115/25955_1 /ASSEMBLY_ACC=CAM_ASM_000708 /TAXON_ID=236786 /ORGANISM="Florenciella sp., Strain RCC1007" /LENGTH=104 /DNA_ID=CAMNT_0053299951 /DNA_START=34 /DNA_END=345 /DNA_ORIENTATION=-
MAEVLERQAQDLSDIAESARSQCIRAMGEQAFTDLYQQLHANSPGNPLPLSSLSPPAVEALQRQITAALLEQQQQQQQQQQRDGESEEGKDARGGLGGSVIRSV